jgi:hypothetical protein
VVVVVEEEAGNVAATGGTGATPAPACHDGQREPETKLFNADVKAAIRKGVGKSCSKGFSAPTTASYLSVGSRVCDAYGQLFACGVPKK